MSMLSIGVDISNAWLDAFAGLLTARDDPRADDCGKSVFIKPADLSAWAARTKRSLAARSGYRSSREPALVAGAKKITSVEPVFIVHVLSGEKPPAKAAK